MPLLITNRIMTKIGAPLIKLARNLCQAAFTAKQRNKYQIIDGFLLRATGRVLESDSKHEKDGGAYVATVMDVPGNVFFGGSLSLPLFVAPGVAVPAGIRDDFVAPGAKTEFQVLDKSGYYLMPVPARRVPSGLDSATDWFPAIQQRDWFLGYSRMDLPVLRDFPDRKAWYLDDETYFTYATVVALTGSITSFFSSARSLTIANGGVTIGEIGTNYFLRNQFAIDESALPEDWKLYPRRLVPRGQCAPEFEGRRYPGITMSGFAILPTSTATALEGVDLYCHAARTFKQYQTPWGEPDNRGYDRYGQQGMLIAVGAQDREDYNVETGASVFAQTQSLKVLKPTDIEQAYLHPAPEKLQGDLSGKPELPNFGTFYTPTPVQCAKNFAVFSAYLTFRNLDGTTPSSMSGDLWSILTTLPGGRTVSLRADWNAQSGEIETGIPGEFMQPWIVGGAPVPGENGTATAYCLVWEQTYARKGTTPIKGEWAMYSTAGGTPVRRTLTGGAPPFASLMTSGPTLFDDSNYDVSNPLSSLYYAGDNKLVTASINYPASSGSRSIKCAIFDVEASTISIRGEIAISNDPLEKCLITPVQPFIPRIGDRDAVPAVLLATITRHSVDNDGTGGKVYLSLDGGATWRIYITDAGGQGGAFYVGNKMWRYDLNRSLDGRSNQ